MQTMRFMGLSCARAPLGESIAEGCFPDGPYSSPCWSRAGRARFPGGAFGSRCMRLPMRAAALCGRLWQAASTRCWRVVGERVPGRFEEGLAWLRAFCVCRSFAFAPPGRALAPSPRGYLVEGSLGWRLVAGRAGGRVPLRTRDCGAPRRIEALSTPQLAPRSASLGRRRLARLGHPDATNTLNKAASLSK